MTRRLFILFASLLFAMAASAQNIIGHVVDEQQKPVPYANVVLVDQKDSTFMTGVVTTEDGRFSIASDNMQCIMRISSIGYQTRHINTLRSNMATFA